MNQITVEEAKELKTMLQSDIQNLIQEFTEQTGIKVNFIDVGIVDAYRVINDGPIYAVFVDTEL